MRISRLLLTVLVLLVLTSSSGIVSAQELGKFGHVDLEKIFKASKKFNRVKQQIEKDMEARSQKVEKMRNDFLDETKSFSLERELLQPDVVKEKQMELTSKKSLIEQTIVSEMKEFDQTKEELMAPLTKELQVVVDEIASAKGYSFIFKRQYLAYADPKFDITAEVIAKLDENEQ